MRAKELAEMSHQIRRETEDFLTLHLDDRVPRFHSEPLLPFQAIVSQPSRRLAQKRKCRMTGLPDRQI